MSAIELWLLPGMDGTGRLFGPLLDALGPELDVRVAAYPPHLARYDALAAELGAPERPTVIAAESFSGPLAIRLAHEHASHVRALVTIASFARGSKGPARLGPLLSPLLALRPPRAAIRALMLGADAPAALVDRVREVITSVPPSTLVERVRETARADVRGELAKIAAPVVWIRARRDRLVPARATAEARAARPGLELREIDGPHLLAQARAREVAAVLRDVIARA